ncbi:MAG TPA: hypothetical protein VFU49_16935 [Ktedonobacteraceae bacterium]|nr:hypothetical protein [Ktedonobacteraceae bacterium]
MNDHNQFEGTTHPQTHYEKLAFWLQEVLRGPLQTETLPDLATGEAHLELLLGSDYHLHFYQQLPDFVMAILTNDPMAAIHYAPLLYHLVGCQQCHTGYLELYDAMRYAIQPQRPRSTLGQGTRTLAAIPQRMLGHLCQTLISQAEAVLQQARHDHSNDDVTARGLLQLAISISSHIAQSHIRRFALQDLVRVALIFEGPSPPSHEDPNIHAYVPSLAGTGGMRGGRKTVRHAELLTRSPRHEQPVIHLQSQALEGSITQRESMLELHLQDLDESLRGRHVTVSVLLGTLIEPIRWVGGNPHAIRSPMPVDAAGALIMPLGETELRLDKPEDHNLLEAVFLRIEIQASS